MIDVRAFLTRITSVAALAAAVGPVAAFAQTGQPAAPPVSAAAARPEGFYLVAGAGVDRSTATRFRDRDCESTAPAALYGCGNGVDGAPLSSHGDFGRMAGVHLGIGHAVSPALRLEAVVQHRPGFTFTGRANFLQTTERQEVSADVSSLTGLLAAYLDLAARGLPRLGPFSPFIGGGAGLSRIAIDETRMEFPRTTTVVPDGRQVGFAWMLAAGVATSLADRVTLDVAWRYMHSGHVETGRATGRVVWRDGRRDPLEIELAETSAKLAGQGLRLSVRYAF